MIRHLRHLPAFGMLLWATTFLGAQGVKPANYYPLDVGNQWTYQIKAGDKGENTASAISSIAKIETIDGLALARLEASVNGRVIATEHLRQTEQGIFRHRNNGLEIDKAPICLLKYPAKSGMKWEGEFKDSSETVKYFCETGEEIVQVPAGKFKAMRVSMRMETKSRTGTHTYWFAPDVGLVKQTVNVPELKSEMALEKFERAKKAPAKEKAKDPGK